ncbi:MAG: bifunctional metallophosphatase/5'-nucleotidase [Chloroflexi bacterium]|nr:bifunctional metallophosphatase/5'-nucleotidase [Chloroflexota bacterium]
MLRRFSLMFVLLLALVAAFSVSAQDDDTTFTLQILHSSDNESSFQDPNTLEPKLLNYGTILEGLRQLAPNGNSLHFTAGDHVLPGPFYEAAAEVEGLGANGLGDIAAYNALGVLANGIGNHEFDGGIDEFAQMLNAADYPFLAVNLDFSNVQLSEGVPPIRIGEDGLSVEELAGHVARSAYVEVGGERIGLIGRAPAGLFDVLLNPEELVPGLDFYGGQDENRMQAVSAVGQVLEQVELLESQGINKIILLDHAQDWTSDPLSAQFLRGIDIIVAAGSTGFMARPEADGPFNLLREGDEAQADYPTVRRDSEGNFVLVINTEQLYLYVGHLIVTFDDAGRLLNIDPISGPVATTDEAIAALSEVVGAELAPPADLVELFDSLVNTDLVQSQFEVIGTTTAELNGQREGARTRETNLGRLTADSTLWWARNTFPERNVDIAVKNGGGIRETILGPNITRLVINTSLAFDNPMVVVEMTGDQVLAAMENSIFNAPGSSGGFLQVAGLYLEYDASRPGINGEASLDTPSRIRTLIITRADGSEDVLVEDYQAQGDLSRTFNVATNGFLLGGGDGYASMAAAAEQFGFEDPGVGERQILIDYITEALGGMVDIQDPPADPRVVRVDSAE